MRAVVDGSGAIKQTSNYYPFGMRFNPTDISTNKYLYNGKELQEGTEWLDYGARMYASELGRWMCVDPLAEKRSWLSVYNYCQNNPVLRIDPDGMLDDIEITGDNNSSITLKTDLIDIKVDASNILGDLGGNYIFEGEDLLVAGLDIVGIFDPSPTSDALSASIESKRGNLGGAILSGLGVIPYVGDLGKVYPDIPNSSLQQLIQMNKSMYPSLIK